MAVSSTPVCTFHGSKHLTSFQNKTTKTTKKTIEFPDSAAASPSVVCAGGLKSG